jgi:regulator of protease activity HflC (stomatin/prohibitin superfamily)
MEGGMNKSEQGELAIVSFLLLVGLGLLFGGMWGCPQYNVWQKGLEGQAQLAQASANRKIAIQEAEAKKEAAVMLAEAEVARARGVAEANKIIGDSLKNNEQYLRYLWIHNLESGNNSVIYVPTEAGLPILEAGKREGKP